MASPIAELFAVEEVQVKRGRLWVPEKRELFQDPARLQAIKLLPLAVRWNLSAASAAAMNGHAASPLAIVAIGAGTLGSQVVNNLWRGGFGEWTVVDDDDIEPHNPARHRVSAPAVGYNKAHALAAEMAAVFPDRPTPAWIPCNYLAPSDHAATLSAALGQAGLVLDFTASVTVERRLARDTQTTARRMSTFLNQRGDESVLLVEDQERRIDLFWLEAEYLRAVAFDPALAGHFDGVKAVGHRYGNACREISVIVPQDAVAVHSGLLSHAIRRAAGQPRASVVISRWSREGGAVSVVKPAIQVPTDIEAAGWRLRIHPEVLAQLRELRRQHLPNETGGVLLGLVDRAQRQMAIIGLLPAPSDSDAWPTSFMRGSNGLTTSVGNIVKRTLGNIGYVGEWHSHPDGHNSRPSELDVVAVALCAPHTRADALPTVMVIVAAGEIGLVVQPVDQDKIHHCRLSL